MRISIINYTGTLFLMLTLVMVGCKMTEKYQRPDLKEPDNYYGSESTGSDSLNMVGTNWKDFFSDSLLVALIDTAMQSNIDLQIADMYVEIGMARLKQARANNYPSVGAYPFRYRRDRFGENYNNYNSNRSRRFYNPDNVPESFYTERLEYESFVDVSWELDIWGKLSSQKRQSQLSYMRTREFQKAVQTSLVADIASAYFYLSLLKSQIEVYKSNLILNDNTLQIVKLQFDAGEVTSLAVKQTLSQKLRAQTLIPQLEREYIKQENRLNRLLGRQAQPIEVANLDLPMVDEEYVTGRPLELLSNRPDVAAAELRLRESYERVGVAKAMKYPSINLGASLGLNSFQLDQLLNPAGSGFLLLNGAVFQPIFQRRRLKTNYEVALAEKKIAELEFRDRFLRAMNEVSDALVAIDKLKEEYVIAQERVEAARNAVQDAAFLFRSGLADYLEIITAQREALDSELNLENVKMRIFTADVELYRSLGGGWR